MHQAEHLNVQQRVLDVATIPTDALVLYIGPTYITLVLDLDKLALYDEAKNFNDVSDDLVAWYRFNQGDLIVGLEVCHLFCHPADDLKSIHIEFQLRVNINVVRNLTQAISHEQNVAFLECRLEVKLRAVFHK